MKPNDLTTEEKSLTRGEGDYWLISVFDSVDAHEHTRVKVEKKLKALYNATKGRGKNKLFSPIIFSKKNRKKKSDFFSANFIGLDIDKRVPVSEFVKRAGNLKIAAFATQSHKSYRYGEIQECYRVIVLLDRPITNLQDYLATIDALYSLFGDIVDQSCKDAARKFYFANEDYEPLYINEDGDPFPVVDGDGEHKKRALEILEGRPVDELVGFNDAGTILKSVIIDGQYYFTDLINSRNYASLKKVRKDSLLLTNGLPIHCWLPANVPVFNVEIENFKKNGVEFKIAKKIGIKLFQDHEAPLYFIDLEEDISFLPGLRINTPTGVRLWLRVRSDSDLEVLRSMLQKSSPNKVTYGPGTLCKEARCPVIPAEIKTLKENTVPFFSKRELARDQAYRKAVKLKRRRKKKKDPTFAPVYSILSHKLARLAFKGDIPKDLHFRNKPSEAILRIILGTRAFRENEEGSALNVYTMAEAASILSDSSVTAMSVSRFIKKLVTAGYISTDGIYKRGKHAKRYRPTDKMKEIISTMNIPSPQFSSLESLPAPTEGSFNRWVFVATRYASTEREFLSELTRLHGDFMAEKEDRYTEARKAWKSNERRRISAI